MIAHTVNTTQVAQARCSEGIAAYSSGGGCAAWPVPSATAIESENPAPGNSRGGATGHTANTIRPATLVSTKVLRATRYTAGAANQHHASTLMASVRCASWYHQEAISRSVR